MTPFERWAARRRRDPAIRLMKRRGLARLTAGLPSGARICDLGCGAGDDAAALSAAGWRVFAADREPGMVALARARLAGTRATVARAPFESPPSRWRGTMDAVWSFHAADHAPGIAAFARTCALLLRAGGRAVFTAAMPWRWQRVLTRLHQAPPPVHEVRRGRPTTRIRYAGRHARVQVLDLPSILTPFTPGFEVLRVEPLGLLLPGAASLPGAGRRLPRPVLRVLDRIESRLAFPAAVRLADHALVIVRKR